MVQFNAQQLYSLAQEVTLLLLEMTQEDSPAKSDSSNKNSTSHWWDQGEVHSLRHEEYNREKKWRNILEADAQMYEQMDIVPALLTSTPIQSTKRNKE